MPILMYLAPGTPFRLAELTDVTGVLVKNTEGRSVVRLDRPVREVEFVGSNGEERHFRCRGTHVTSWARTTMVVPMTNPCLEINPMTKKTATKKSTATKAAPAKKVAAKAKPAKKSDGQMSALDAAAKVLAEALEAMTTTELVDAMAAKKYWTSPGGKTPAATLYSAILREIQTKGKDARFTKTERGKFAIKG